MYKVIRFYSDLNRENETMKTGLTLEEAKEHCQRADTHKRGEWFDGYTKDCLNKLGETHE